MREIRLYGSEGGGAEANRLSLPLSSATLRVVRPPRPPTLKKRTQSVRDGIPTEVRGNEYGVSRGRGHSVRGNKDSTFFKSRSDHEPFCL